MTTKTTHFILLALIAAGVITGIVLYPSLPNQIASHWNAAGEVNGFMSKFWGVSLLPILMIGLFVLRLVVLQADPFKKNVEAFKKYHDGFWIVLFVFLLYIFGLMLAWNLGHRFNFTVMLIPALSVLFYAIAVVMEKSKRNWFMGIRTPWTLSSDIVWDKTHKLGGKLFKIAAIIPLFGILFQNQTVIIVMLLAPILIVTLVTVVYSYAEYKKLPTKPS